MNKKQETNIQTDTLEKTDIQTKIQTEIQDKFKLPIFYNNKKMELTKNIITDLELTKCINDKEKPILNYIFQPTNCFGETIMPNISKYYTTDISFLKNTQKMIKMYKKSIHKKENKQFSAYDFQSVYNAWIEIKGETSFCEKYLYIDWDSCKFLNKNTTFLQAMSIYNITSPIISLFMPIVILIIPFIILKFRGIKVTVNEYLDILKIIISNHAICKMFTDFHKVDSLQRVYLIASSALYVFSIYQNILTCIRFYSNMKKIHDYLNKFNAYIDYTIDKFDQYLNITKTINCYNNFNEEIVTNKIILSKFKDRIKDTFSFSITFMKIMQIGDILHSFYDLYDDIELHNAFTYSFGFHGYLDNLNGLVKNINEKRLNKATLANNEDKNKFYKQYYPTFLFDKHVKNDCDLKTNMIITGPNASGKTTLLKTTIINTILTQQFGYGCYKNAIVTPYKYIHCYLNIPDTSGRDSLFQAEARRCKEIIDCISKNKKEKHFCVFDELYSGTNPEEATESAIAFMEYITKYSFVSCILTTHYIDLCKKLEKNTSITNYNMKTITSNDTLDYTYILQKGISEIKGGCQVLVDMQYPKEILDKIK